MAYLRAATLADAVEMILDSLVNDYQYITSPRGQKIKEIIGMQIEIKDPYSNLFDNEVCSLPRQYLADELYLYFSGSNSAEDFSKASKFWDKIKNEDGTVNSAYGHLIFNKNLELYPLSQWDWAKESLIKDKDSRQAIMHYNKPIHQQMSIKDFVCTMNNQFFIRDDKLEMITYIRSNDIRRGFFFDAPWFMLLMQCMRIELLPNYPELELGSYHHFAGSMHLYEEHFELAEEMLKEDFVPAELPRIEKLPFISMAYNDDPFCQWIRENKKP